MYAQINKSQPRHSLRTLKFQHGPDKPFRTPSQWQAYRRVGELKRLYHHRYQGRLPQNQLGMKLARYVCRTMAFDPIDQREQWLNQYAPWLLGTAERAKILSYGAYWYSRRALGERLELYDVEREALEIRTIEAFDVTKKEREKLNLKKDAARKKRERKRKGATPHEESLARTKPWLALGMGRTSWYANGKPSLGTDFRLLRSRTDSSGSLLRYNEPDESVQKILKLTKNPERHRAIPDGKVEPWVSAGASTSPPEQFKEAA